MKEVKKRGHVIFVDSKGQEHDALVTAVHGTYGESCGLKEGVDLGQPSLNILWITDEEGKTDSWGDQTERESSLVHQTSQGAHGMYWKFPS